MNASLDLWATGVHDILVGFARPGSLTLICGSRRPGRELLGRLGRGLVVTPASVTSLALSGTPAGNVGTRAPGVDLLNGPGRGPVAR